MTSTPPSPAPSAWLVAPAFGVDSEVWMYRQAKGMPELSLRVVTTDLRNQDSFPPEGFEATAIPCPDPNATGRISRQLQIAWRRWRNRSLGGFGGGVSEAAAWRNLVKQDRPRVALCQYGTTAVWMFPLLNALGVPVVAHFHGFDLSSALNRPVYLRQLRRLAPRFEACVVVADYQRDWLLENGCDPARVHKIPCGCPLADLTPADRVGEQPCRFLMVGRLTPKKRPDLSLRAFARCRETHPDVRLTVIGGGELEAECHALADELGLGDSVTWMGSQPPQVVKQQIASAGAFIQHSVTASNGDKEGWPVAIAEAAGSGLPVVATRHASIPEQIEHGASGLLVDEEDWQTMGDHLATLAADPELRQRMGQAARKRLSRFDTSTQVAELQRLLLSIASE